MSSSFVGSDIDPSRFGLNHPPTLWKSYTTEVVCNCIEF
jgi:hypothetical protein